jgi:hypothetical protein
LKATTIIELCRKKKERLDKARESLLARYERKFKVELEAYNKKSFVYRFLIDPPERRRDFLSSAIYKGHLYRATSLENICRTSMQDGSFIIHLSISDFNFLNN